MGAKDLRLAPIDAADANRLVRRIHYSGKVKNNSQFHIGVFWRGRLEGCLQFGPSNDKAKMLPLVAGSAWNDFTELNRMVLSEALPRNSESRAIAVSMRLLRRHAPQIQWVISFADATQCGDGTIYRASGFVLTGITPSRSLYRLPDGSVMHPLSITSTPARPRPELGGRSLLDLTNGGKSIRRWVEETGAVLVPGYQMRYIYFIDPTARDRLTVPEIPYSEITRLGAGMYRGERLAGGGGADGGTPDHQSGGGGSTPTPPLQTGV